MQTGSGRKETFDRYPLASIFMDFMDFHGLQWRRFSSFRGHDPAPKESFARFYKTGAISMKPSKNLCTTNAVSGVKKVHPNANAF